MSDGATAVMVTRRATAAALGLPVLGALKSYAVVGVPPDVMGIGPAFAIPVALRRAGEISLGTWVQHACVGVCVLACVYVVVCVHVWVCVLSGCVVT